MAFTFNTTSYQVRKTDFADVQAALTALGKTYLRSVSLHPRGADGDDSNIISEWGWSDNDTVANRVIVPRSPIRLNRVTATPYGIVASVVGGVVTLVNGHTLPPALTARLIDVSAGAELGDISATVAGNVITLASLPGALAAGDLIIATGYSEFSIGGSARAVYLQVNSTSVFSSGLYIAGTVRFTPVTWERDLQIRAGISGWTPTTTGHEIGVGWNAAALGLVGRNAGAEIRQGVYPGAYPGSLVADSSEVGLCQPALRADDTVTYTVRTYKLVAAGTPLATAPGTTVAQLTGVSAVLKAIPSMKVSYLKV